VKFFCFHINFVNGKEEGRKEGRPLNGYCVLHEVTSPSKLCKQMLRGQITCNYKRTIMETNVKGLLLGHCPKRTAFRLFEKTGYNYNLEAKKK